MALIFTGKSETDVGFDIFYEAYDGAKRVIVYASRAALDDHGLSAVQDKAREKYARGQTSEDEKVRIVTSDFDRPSTPH